MRIGVMPPASVASGQLNSDEQTNGSHLYELELAQSLPTFDLTKTLVSKLLPSKAHDRLIRAMHPKLNAFLVWLFRVSLLCFGCLLFVPVKAITFAVPLMVAAIVLPPAIFVAFFSLDLLVLLAHHYEFWFVTALNTLNWVGLGVIFGDIRAISCFGLWLSSQSVVLIDSNYRTFPTAIKSIIISGPFLILLVVCCSYSLIADADFPAIKIGKLTLQSRQVVVFTASTLSVFVVKKAYTKNRRLRLRLRDRESDPDTAQGLHTIPCVGLHARLKLSQRKVRKSLGQTQFSASTMRSVFVPEAGPATLTLDAAALNSEKLTLAPYDPFVVDARNVVLPGYLLKWMEAPYAQSAVYATGVVGLSSTAIAWMVIFYRNTENATDQLKGTYYAWSSGTSTCFSRHSKALRLLYYCWIY
ncbi:hypothetical protein KRP22_006976 [Phytophthora ramorum]|nr:hypothetical protein KRP22_1927 [Phytophthora ramorum]